MCRICFTCRPKEDAIFSMLNLPQKGQILDHNSQIKSTHEHDLSDILGVHLAQVTLYVPGHARLRAFIPAILDGEDGFKDFYRSRSSLRLRKMLVAHSCHALLYTLSPTHFRGSKGLLWVSGKN